MNKTILSLALFGISALVSADVELASVFGDHMVLQRDSKVPIWGKAEPGEDVSVAFNGQTVSAKADADGKWEVNLAPMKFGGPYELAIQGKNKVTLQDVLIGDVWLFSGQSNAPWGVGQDSKKGEAYEMADKCPQVRHTRLAYLNNTNEYPLRDFPARAIWEVGSSKTAKFGSPSFFLPKINMATGIPQGFYLVARAATQIEAWTSMDGFDSVKGLDDMKKKLACLKPDNEEYHKATRKIIAYTEEWLSIAKRDAEAGRPVRPFNIPDRVIYKDAHKYPSMLYNGSIAPIAPMAVKGMFWYQGESNVGDPLYREKLVAFTNGLRIAFRNPELKMLLVQPCPYKGYGNNNQNLALVWEQQQDFADSDGHSYICVTNDISDVNDWHPKEKHDIPYRMANLALKYIYGKSDIKADFPRCEKVSADGNKLVISFKYAEKLHTSNGKAPDFFEVAGTDGKYYPARAEIDGNKVILTSDSVKEPKKARFAWSNVAEPNLRNEAGLPPGAFRTERD